MAEGFAVMVRTFLAVLVSTSLLIPVASARTAEPEVLRSTKPWELNYDDDSCHLLGVFGEGERQIVLRFTRYEPSVWFELVAYGQGLRASGLELTTTTDFGSDGSGVRTISWSGNSGGKPMIIFGPRWLLDEQKASPSQLPPPSPEQEQAVRNLTIRVSSARPMRIELGPMAKPMAAIRACTTDLVKSWGLDPDVQAKLSRRASPTGNPGNWLRPNDYPAKALINGNNGLVHFRLQVSPEGTVAGCHVQLATRPEEFATTTCALLAKRAKFIPALDSEGKPVASYFVSTVRWMMG